MKTILKSVMVVGLLAGVAHPALAQKAAAPANSGPVVPGIAIANVDAVVASSNAQRTAASQRPTTYKAQIDAYQAKGNALQAQLKPLIDKYQKDAAAPNANQASLQQQEAAIRQIQGRAEQEMNQIVQPVAYSEAYVNEQIEAKLDQAVSNAMTKKNISLLLAPQSVVKVTNNAYNLNQDILNELNTLIPSAQIVPPQGWEPRQIREARAQQAQQQGGAAPAAPAATAPKPAAGPQPEGR